MKKNEWMKEFYTYRNKLPVPPVKENLQEFIDLYFAEGDEKYFEWFLYYYEPTLNSKAMDIVEEYSMKGHFADIKEVIVYGMIKARDKYDISLGVPFLAYKENYVNNEVDEYIRTMRLGFTIQSADEYKLARKAMALYRDFGYKSDDSTIQKIAAAIGKKDKDTREIVQGAFNNTRFVDFYRTYVDEDGNKTSEDVTCDYSYEPSREYIHIWREEALFGAFKSLNHREREMISDHLGFCSECFGIFEKAETETGKIVAAFRKRKAYIDLAAEHTLSSPDTAYRICNSGYEKMLIDLAVGEYIHIVEFRLKEKTNTYVTYEYCADHNNDWGEIRYTLGEDDYDVTRYVYADKQGGFFFAAAGDWIMLQAGSEKYPKRKIIVSDKLGFTFPTHIE